MTAADMSEERRDEAVPSAWSIESEQALGCGNNYQSQVQPLSSLGSVSLA